MDEMERVKKAAYMRAWRARHGARTGQKGPAQSAVCGSRSGYHRHRKNGEQPCGACVEAERAYSRSRRARKV